jgi:hypothetical protein
MSEYPQELIEAAEREAFEKAFQEVNAECLHLAEPFDRYNGQYYRNTEVDIAWTMWQARAKLQQPCRGIAHPGCDYLAGCGTVCNKCGQSV